MKNEKFSFKRRIQSFVFAFHGIKSLITEEHNFRIHLIAAVCAIAAGFILKISSYEWLAIILAIGLVFSLEIINTSIERLADLVSEEKNVAIKRVKDLCAAAVLVSAAIALVIAMVVFIPKIISLL